MLRHFFNLWQLEQRAQDGTLVKETTWSRPASTKSGQPVGTVSRFYEYRERGTVLAKAHHYDRPDKAWLPDPKWLLLDDGRLLRDPHGDDEECQHCRTYKPLCKGTGGQWATGI